VLAFRLHFVKSEKHRSFAKGIKDFWTDDLTQLVHVNVIGTNDRFRFKKEV
jgi:hypothetical protein